MCPASVKTEHHHFLPSIAAVPAYMCPRSSSHWSHWHCHATYGVCACHSTRVSLHLPIGLGNTLTGLRGFHWQGLNVFLWQSLTMHRPGFPHMPMHVPGIMDAFFLLCLFRGESKCITSTWESSSCPLEQSRISVWVWSHCCLQAAACSLSGLTNNFCSCLLAWSQSRQKSCSRSRGS